MKLSFSIQNWNDQDWNDFCQVALETRMQGIELYDIAGPVFRGKQSPTNPELSQGIRRFLSNQGLKLSCLAARGDFSDRDFLSELSRCVETAVNLGISYISLHTQSEDLKNNTEQIGKLIDAVGTLPVTLLVETSGVYADTGKLRDLLNYFADDRLAAVWNMYETTVTGGEDAQTTITNLGAYVRHVHIHDYRTWKDNTFPELMVGIAAAGKSDERTSFHQLRRFYFPHLGSCMDA